VRERVFKSGEIVKYLPFKKYCNCLAFFLGEEGELDVILSDNRHHAARRPINLFWKFTKDYEV
jgi:hypothetical protein